MSTLPDDPKPVPQAGTFWRSRIFPNRVTVIEAFDSQQGVVRHRFVAGESLNGKPLQGTDGIQFLDAFLDYWVPEPEDWAAHL